MLLCLLFSYLKIDSVKVFTSAFLVTFVLLLFSCEDKNKETNGPDNNAGAADREAVLVNIADNIVIPGYDSFKEKLDSLTSAFNSFSTQPDESGLQDFRNDFVQAYIEWQKVQLFNFGPADEFLLINYMNIYPTDTAQVIQNIINGNANLGALASFDEQGFPALDYMLYGIGGSESEIVSLYTSDQLAEKRLAYLQLIIDQMNMEFYRVYNTWNTGYRDIFVSKTGTDIGSSFGQVVNGFIQNYEVHIRKGKVATPAGVLTGIEEPQKVEAFYNQELSGILAETAHEAAYDFFNGIGFLTGQKGASFATYLNSLGAKDSKTGNNLSDMINTQFGLISDALSGLNDNYYDQVTTNNAALVDTFDKMQTLVRLLKVDLTSAMSISITYADNDGD